MPIINVIPDPIVLPTRESLVDENKRLQQELDTWKKAYAKAENESRRFQEEYEKMYHKYMVLKNRIEPVYDLVNEITGHLVMAQIVKD